jgi:hypothetical protein
VLQDKDGAPGWVQELLRSSVLVEAPRFSKFIHGMALLQYSKVQEAPSWFLSKEGGMPMPASIEEMWEMTAEKRAEKLEYMQVRACSKNVSIQMSKFNISKIQIFKYFKNSQTVRVGGLCEGLLSGWAGSWQGSLCLCW